MEDDNKEDFKGCENVELDPRFGQRGTCSRGCTAVENLSSKGEQFWWGTKYFGECVASGNVPAPGSASGDFEFVLKL